MAHNPALTLMIKRFNVLDNEYNQTVQSIIEKLKVSHIELRSDESIDIQQYNHTRKVDLHVLKLEDDMLKIKNAFLNVRCVLSVLFVQLWFGFFKNEATPCFFCFQGDAKSHETIGNESNLDGKGTCLSDQVFHPGEARVL